MAENKFFEKFLDNINRLDETDIKNIFESVESERRLFRLVLDSLDEALIVLTEDKILFLNQAARKILVAYQLKPPVSIEEAKRQMINRNIIDFIKVSLFDDDYQTELVEHGKENRYYEIEKMSMDDGVFVIKIWDISEQKKMQFQLKNLESVAALNTLAAGIAHEIKNPLTAIDLHTQIIKKGIQKRLISVPEEVDNYLRIIDEEQKRLSKIVNDFLLTARRRELKLTFEDMNSFVEEVLALVQPEIDEAHVDLELDLKSVPKIFIDKEYLKQAVLNLIKNALESMKPDTENSVYTRLNKLMIASFYDKGMDAVALTISDTGGGIDPEKLSRIFEPYFTTKEYGTGLGLTLVYKIIKEHGGDIRVDSQKDLGSSFTIYLPLNKGTRLITQESSV